MQPKEMLIPEDLTVLNLDGEPVKVSALAERRPAVVALLRHFG